MQEEYIIGRHSKEVTFDSPLADVLFDRLLKIDRLTRLVVVVAFFQLSLAIVELWQRERAGWLSPVRVVTIFVILLPVLVLIIGSLRAALKQVTREWGLLERNARSGMGMSEDWLWTIDREARFVYSSPSVSRFLGYSSEELMRRDSIEVMVPDANADAVRSVLEDCATRRVGWSSWDLELKRRDGTSRYVRSDAVPLLTSDGELMGWQGSAHDKTAYVVGVHELTHRRAEINAVIEGEEGLFEVVLQSIFDLDSGLAVGAEALSRFKAHPLRGPDLWFAAAHEVGLGLELEIFAITRALEKLGKIPQGSYLSINVSPDVFLTLDPGQEPLNGVEGHRIVLELTEHALIEKDRYPAMRHKVEVLRQAGIRVAVDDTGAGFASLVHVLELTPDFIKLDHSMVRGIGDDWARSALAVSIAGFADRIGAVVIAEGIESGAELQMIRNTGIRFGQGFGLALPGSGPVPERSLLHPDVPAVRENVDRPNDRDLT